ncbi:substrate-binding domain-containing protein [Nocardia sp. CA-120079]|uniref:substrate-binding domain-containing protein n=1 Tax=Nocardia sp. CA-120079 TaxID=3239974 RepID=UPI003D960F18
MLCGRSRRFWGRRLRVWSLASPFRSSPTKPSARCCSTGRSTAIFAVNDNTAIGVMAAATAFGLRMPEDLALVGYNDIPIVSRLPVPLTTVRVPFAQIATGAIELLADRDVDETSRTLVVTPMVISCGSSGAWRLVMTTMNLDRCA